MTFKSNDTGGDWASILEPESAASKETPPNYPDNSMMHSKSGHTFEMDDTAGRERIRLNHRSGTFIEMHPNGQEVHKIYGDGYELVLGNKKVKVYGSCVISVDGDAAIQVKKSANIKVNGNLKTLVDGSIDITAKKELNLNSERINLNAGNLSMGASKVDFTSDLNVTGALKVQQSAIINGNITTTGAVYSMGGLATPGSIIVGPASMGSPLPLMYSNQVLITAATVNVLSLTEMTLSATAAAAITSGAAMAITSVGAMGLTSAGTLAIAASTIEVATTSTTMTGLLTVAGLITAADFFCMVNPTFYSVHSHLPLVTPPSIV